MVLEVIALVLEVYGCTGCARFFRVMKSISA